MQSSKVATEIGLDGGENPTSATQAPARL